MSRVQAIVVTWNKRESVSRLLASLRRQSFPGGDLSVVVVDNASTDGTAEHLAQEFPEVVLVRNAENLGGTGGFVRGLSWALEHSDAERYWLLDDDVVLHRDALLRLDEALDASPGFGALGSAMLQLDRPFVVNEVGAFFDRERGSLVLNQHREEIDTLRGRPLADLVDAPLAVGAHFEIPDAVLPVDYCAAASLLVRASVVRAVGLWEDFFIHFDDVEWCLRMAGAGFAVGVVPDSVVWHVAGDAKIPTWVQYYDARNALLTVRRHAPGSFVSATAHHVVRAMGHHLAGRGSLGSLLLDGLDHATRGVRGKRPDLVGPAVEPLEELPAILKREGVTRCVVAATIEENLRPRLAPLLSQAADDGIDVRLYDPSGRRLVWLPGQRTLRAPAFLPLRFIWWLFHLLFRLGREECIVHSYRTPVVGAGLVARVVVTASPAGILVHRPSLRHTAADLLRGLRLVVAP